MSEELKPDEFIDAGKFIDYVWSLRAERDQLRADLSRLKAGQGEAVAPIEVIGYASPGQVDILRNVPRTGGMKVKGSPDNRYTEPVVLLSAAKSAVFQAVIRCEKAGAFKTCMECGYQDGHDQICQYHGSTRVQTVKREDVERFLVSYHAEVWAAAEDDDSRVAYDEAGRTLATAFLARFSDIAPPTPDATQVMAPRELLERATANLSLLDARPRSVCRDCADYNGVCPSGLDCDISALTKELRALLAQSEGVKP